MKSKKELTLLEHGSLFCKKEITENESFVYVTPSIFSEIEQFILENSDTVGYLLTPSYSKQYGKTLKACEFVGVIETKSGVVIEILPKIATNNNQQEVSRKTLIKMISTLKTSPFKKLNLTNLNTEKMHLFEIFIAMFCDSISHLIKKGIKSDYISIAKNNKFLKGSLQIAQHIRYNTVHKEHFFVQYDEYQQNRLENRIIKSTLLYLSKKSRSKTNQKKLREFLFVFDSISPIHNPDNAFARITKNRQLKEYEEVLRWCKLFLNNESFTSFVGKNIAFALLFNMNKLFEDYVAHCLKKEYPRTHITTQLTGEYLLVNPHQFSLRPDIKIGDTIIADTKWKTLSNEKTHLGLSQSDMYQMYAYGKKYKGTKEIFLIYPYTEEFPTMEKTLQFDDDTDKPLYLKIFAFDCVKRKFVPPLSINIKEE